MSDSLPENNFSGVLKVVKLITGEEIVGFINEYTPNKITIKLPAKLESYYSKDQSGNNVEYIKLINYVANIKGFEIFIEKSSIIFIGQPNVELEKMYEIYFMAMQSDPRSIVSTLPEGFVDVDSGLNLLNDLFNNEDFVGFVNDLIDNFEGVEIFAENEEDLDDGETDLESPQGGVQDQEPESKPERKKRRIVKPEASKLPYKPENPPDDPKSWSDNPLDYI